MARSMRKITGQTSVTTSVKWRVAGRPGWLSQFLLA
jgi:hypothetical protein